MTRRDLIRLPAAASFPAAPAASQLPYPGVRYRQYSRCLPDYVAGLARVAYERRNRDLALLTTPDRVRARQRWARDTFWRLIGGMPERTPLDARVTGTFERAGYKFENIVYQSRPNLHVTANLYIPASGRPPYPGVLFQMGHTLNGKACDSYQRCCQALARLGYLVLAFDPMGQGERTYYPRENGTLTRLRSADDEHTHPGRQLLLAGDTSTRFQVWDAVRSLDYLAAHPLADPKRLASTGQSGGGTLTMLLACVDDRLACAAVSSGNTENVACAGFNPPGSTDDAEQDFLDSGPAGFDRWDVLYPIAPKPLLVAVSSKDWFGTYSHNYIKNGWEEFQKLQRAYEILGAKHKIAWADTPLPHNLAYGMRLHVYRWFEKWLRPAGEPREIREEPPTAPEPEDRLWASAGGNAVRALGGETPFSLARKAVAPKPGGKWREVLRSDFPAPALAFTELGRSPFRDTLATAVEVASAPAVWLPAWIYESRPAKPGAAGVLILDPGGRNGRWNEEGPWPKRALQGEIVCVADVRGCGDLLPEFPRGAPGHARSHQEEEDYAWASLILGKPLLGQRVTDVMALAKALANRTKGKVRVEAQGKLTVPALFAAALSKDIESLHLSGGLISYRSVMETLDYRQPTANFAFNLANQIDLPELAESMAPRKLTLTGMVDAAGKPVEPAAVRVLYGSGNVEVLG